MYMSVNERCNVACVFVPLCNQIQSCERTHQMHIAQIYVCIQNASRRNAHWPIFRNGNSNISTPWCMTWIWRWCTTFTFELQWICHWQWLHMHNMTCTWYYGPSIQLNIFSYLSINFNFTIIFFCLGAQRYANCFAALCCASNRAINIWYCVFCRCNQHAWSYGEKCIYKCRMHAHADKQARPLPHNRITKKTLIQSQFHFLMGLEA